MFCAFPPQPASLFVVGWQQHTHVHAYFLAELPLARRPACLPARLPACSAYQILIFLSSTAWGLLTVLCLWPPIWTMLPRQAHSLHSWTVGARPARRWRHLPWLLAWRAALHGLLLQMLAIAHANGPSPEPCQTPLRPWPLRSGCTAGWRQSKGGG